MGSVPSAVRMPPEPEPMAKKSSALSGYSVAHLLADPHPPGASSDAMHPPSSPDSHSGSELDVISDGGEDDSTQHLVATTATTSTPATTTTTSTTTGNSKNRRRRTAFSTHQLMELEREFQAKKYLSLTERSQIAQQLRLSEVQIK